MCPSGCRLSGLLARSEDEITERLRRVCEKAGQYEAASSSTMLASARFYETQRKIIVRTYMDETRFAAVADRLQRNLTLLWKKSMELSRQLQRHHSQIAAQIDIVRRTEVDVDIKLRACKGSCKRTFDRSIDPEAFRAAEDEMASFDPARTKPYPFAPDKTLHLQPADRRPVSFEYRQIPIVRSKLLTKFEDIEQNQVVMDVLQEDWRRTGTFTAHACLLKCL